MHRRRSESHCIFDTIEPLFEWTKLRAGILYLWVGPGRDSSLYLDSRKRYSNILNRHHCPSVGIIGANKESVCNAFGCRFAKEDHPPNTTIKHPRKERWEKDYDKY